MAINAGSAVVTNNTLVTGLGGDGGVLSVRAVAAGEHGDEDGDCEGK